jgi:pyruvate/2-oxoglutarate dehydrogenase complex dihydrolipoamide acyltransferase (E2) component
VTKLCYKEGEIARVGTTLIEIDVGTSSQPSKGPSVQSAHVQQQQQQQQQPSSGVPTVGQSIDYEYNLIRTKSGFLHVHSSSLYSYQSHNS